MSQRHQKRIQEASLKINKNFCESPGSHTGGYSEYEASIYVPGTPKENTGGKPKITKKM